jgi:hypothetical protein
VQLPPVDASYLKERALTHSVTTDGAVMCVVLPSFCLPSGYDRSNADLLLRLPAGYPDVQPDMWWFDPPVKLNGGRSAPATEVIETHMGRTWQRWSRHLSAGQWRSGIDCLETFLALIRNELLRTAGGTGK